MDVMRGCRVSLAARADDNRPTYLAVPYMRNPARSGGAIVALWDIHNPKQPYRRERKGLSKSTPSFAFHSKPETAPSFGEINLIYRLA